MSRNRTGQKAKQGFSKEYAIQFPSILNAADGVAAEYEWINSNMPGGRIVFQSLIDEGERQYDVITVCLPDGQNVDAYFEITNFYGLF